MTDLYERLSLIRDLVHYDGRASREELLECASALRGIANAIERECGADDAQLRYDMGDCARQAGRG